MKEIILIGASGKMGTMIRQELKDPYKIIGGIDLGSSDFIDRPAEAVIDFSSPPCTMKYAPFYLAKRIPYICGTTGFTDQEIATLEQMTAYYCGHFRLCSSFDVHFAEILMYLERNKKLFTKAIIEEWHYINKLDLPSGTAKTLQNTLRPLKTTIIAHRTKSHRLRHQITLISFKRRIIFSYEVQDKSLYIAGIVKSLESISLKGFFKGL